MVVSNISGLQFLGRCFSCFDLVYLYILTNNICLTNMFQLSKKDNYLVCIGAGDKNIPSIVGIFYKP